MPNDLPDGRCLDRLQWERGASDGWRTPNMPAKPTESYRQGFAYGRFWREAKGRA